MEELLKNIYEKIGNGVETDSSDWEGVLKLIKGKDDAETLNNLQTFIKEKFSFKISENAEGYVYYGGVDDNTRVWQLVDADVKMSGGTKGYISSTQAGKLFNAPGFNKVLKVRKKYTYHMTKSN